MPIALTGCAGDPPPLAIEDHEPIGMQLLRAVPSLREERFSTLLDFESKDDAVFCATGSITSERAHTGQRAFKIDAGTTHFTVKLSSLLAGRPFPGEWTLLGAYFYSDQPAKVAIGFDPAPPGVEPRQVDLAGGAWTAVFTDVPAGAAMDNPPSLLFGLQSPHGPLYCDDVLLINNFKQLTAAAPDVPDAHPASDVVAGTMPPWTITRRGLNFIGGSPGRFDFKLITTEAAADGWIVDDANPMRAIFHSNASASTPARSVAIYSDGRAFFNGEYRPMSVAARDATLTQQHLAPAQIEVAEGMGRVDRNTPGDANNDGYNEATGSYRIIATGPRIELRLIPKASPVLSPILEISGLPFGKALITLEGRLIEQSARTSAGTLLVELPARIDRPVTVNVRIEE